MGQKQQDLTDSPSLHPLCQYVVCILCTYRLCTIYKCTLLGKKRAMPRTTKHWVFSLLNHKLLVRKLWKRNHLRKTSKTEWRFWQIMESCVWSDDSQWKTSCTGISRADFLWKSAENYNNKWISSTVKHGGRGVVEWGGFIAAGVSKLWRAGQ